PMHRIATEVLGLEMLYPISTPKPNSADDLIGFIDSYGRVIVQPLYAAGSFFFEGKASVVDWNGKSGFIDNTGNLAIPCEFQGLGNFKDGLCAQSGGYIDHIGDWFIEPRFIVASDFSEGRAFASTDGESFGFIDFSGNFVVPLEFQRCCAFSSGLAAVLREDRWGYIDHEGETRIPHVFEGPIAQPFRYGVAGVQIDGHWGFIGPTGDFVISPEYERVKPFAEGYAPVRRIRRELIDGEMSTFAAEPSGDIIQYQPLSQELYGELLGKRRSLVKSARAKRKPQFHSV
ncbi:MAG TPA: WG repeat-containing protein, partial [Terriglobales bacterium]